MKDKIQYCCAILLVVSSIALAFLQTVRTNDIASGVLIYIAQAFLLVASIFGLAIYVDIIRNIYNNNNDGNKRST